MRAASNLVIFGATGDLAQRMLLPSLLGLERDGLLPESLEVLGAARTEMTREAFLAVSRDALATWSDASGDDRSVERLLGRVDYHPIDLSSSSSIEAFTRYVQQQRGEGDILFHLSTAPSWYPTICAALGINYKKDNYTPEGRPIALTDEGGKPVAELVG